MSTVRLHAARVSETTAPAGPSVVRLHSAKVTGTTPAPGGSRVRLHAARIAGAEAATPGALSRWDPTTGAWVLTSLGMKFWDAILGQWRSIGEIIPTPPATPQTPIDDAGAEPIGSATYAVPTGAIHVSTTGNDSAGGTAAAPVQTLAKALQLAPTNGTVVLRGGSYFEGEDGQARKYPLGVTVAKAGITIQNYPGEAVWFDGSQTVAANWTRDGAANRWSTPYDRCFDRGTNMVMGAAPDPRPGWDWYNPDNPEASWPDLVWLDGVELTQVTTKAELGPGKFWVEGSTVTGNWFQGARLWLGENPAGKEVRYAAKMKFLTAAGAPDLTIRGVGIRKYASGMSTMGVLYFNETSPRITLENVVMEDASAFGIQGGGCSDLHLTKFTMRRIGCEGINLNQVDRLVVDRCVFDYTDCKPYNYNATGSGAIKTCKVQGTTIKNSIFSNGKHGVWTDQSVYDMDIYNCLFLNNRRQAVQYELSGGVSIYNCKFINSGEMHVLIQNTDRARIWNNTCVGIGAGIGDVPSGFQRRAVCYRQDERRPWNTSYGLDNRNPAGFYDQPENQWQINSLELRNNVLARIGSGVQTVLAIDDLERNQGNARLLSAYNPKIDGNLYHWTSQPQYPWFTPDVAKAGSGVTIFFSLASFTSGTGLDVNSTLTTGDPLNEDYTVRDSAIHNRALPLPEDIASLIGQAAGVRHVGCFW